MKYIFIAQPDPIIPTTLNHRSLLHLFNNLLQLVRINSSGITNYLIFSRRTKKIDQLPIIYFLTLHHFPRILNDLDHPCTIRSEERRVGKESRLKSWHVRI